MTPTVRPFLPPPAVSGNGTAVTRHGPPAGPKAKANGPALPAALLYGDGTAVGTGNQTEGRTYNAYLAEKQMPSPSKKALLAYYRPVLAKRVWMGTWLFAETQFDRFLFRQTRTNVLLLRFYQNLTLPTT
jgi:hypothetical protein